MLLMVALAALALSLYFTVRPANAVVGNVAHLQESQKGTDSSEATDDCAGAGTSVPAGEVLWHFILNGLEPGITSAISGHFDFESGTVDVSSSKWNKDGTTHHFYVFTTGDDILNDATADIGGSTYNNFVLSHICHGGETGQSVAESVSESVGESEAQSAEQSVEGSAEQSASGEQSATGEQSVEAGVGTPAGSVNDSAFFGAGSGALPTILFSLILLASLGTLAYANVKTVRSRN
jgi:hypothetical protein